MYTADARPETQATARTIQSPLERPAAPSSAVRPVAPEEICRSEPVLVDLNSLLAHVGAESVEGLLMPSLIVHRKRIHMLNHDVQILDSLSSDRHAPGHARALAVRDQVQRWNREGLLVTVRHQPLSEGLKPAAMARFFGLFGEGLRGCVITQSSETARQMLGPSCWTGQRSTPLMVSVERGGFVTLLTEAVDGSPVLRPVTAIRTAVEPPAPPQASLPATRSTRRMAGNDHHAAAAPPPSPQVPGAHRMPSPSRHAGKPRATPEQQRRLEELIAGDYLFVPDTCSLMHSHKQTARRFFERELLPRLVSARQHGAPSSAAPCIWLHRRVRGELMHHAQSSKDQQLIAKAADGLRAITMMADAGVMVEHDDSEAPVGAGNYYADPALELLLRKHQGRRRLCIITQDRGLAAKLVAQRTSHETGRAEIVKLCGDGTAAIEDWEDILSRSELERGAQEVSVDARVERQITAHAVPGAVAAGADPATRSSGREATAAIHALPTGSTTQGTLKRWKDEQGYGFIQPDGGGPDLFLHIRALPRGSEPPREGDRLHCVVGRDDQGRLRAERAWPENELPRTGPTSSAPDRHRPSASGNPFQAALMAMLLMAALGLAWWLLRR